MSTFVSSVEILLDKLALTAVNEPLISSAICAEELKAPLNIPLKDVASTLPLTNNEPVNLCVSSISSPNKVEPLACLTDIDTTEELTNNSCVVSFPWTVNPEKVGLASVFTDWFSNASLADTLVLNEPLSVFKFVTLVEKLALSVVNAPLTLDCKVESEKSTLKVLSSVRSPPPLKPTPATKSLACKVSILPSSVVILVEKLALSACKASIFPSSVVILVEKLALSACNAVTLSSAVLTLVEKLALSLVNEPLILDANVVSEKSTVSVLSEVKSPPPLNPKPVLMFRACNVSTFDSSNVTRVEKLALAVSKSVVLVENEELGAVNEPLISSAIWAEELNAPSNIPVNEVAFTLSSISILPNEADDSKEPVYLLLNIAIK